MWASVLNYIGDQTSGSGFCLTDQTNPVEISDVLRSWIIERMMQINYPSLLLRLVKIIKLSAEEVERLV